MEKCGQPIIFIILRVAIAASFLSLPCMPSCEAAQDAKKSVGGLFRNERLKSLTLPDRPIVGDSTYRVVEGLWTPESKDPDKALVFPQQVRIECHRYEPDDKKCVEIAVTLAPVKVSVSVQDIATQEYDIDKWDAHGLVASFGGDNFSSKCQRHVLTMDFDSGAVSVTDIPTHSKGCEAFKETDAYRLVRGNYYVDTTPDNDLDKPTKTGNQ